uniref:Secreted protein n=1 Tax=Trypanosoma vivax (strain Y486) TaxID=1055687 RepID=G0TXW1_TRYVY|nr:hypothetical protein TVY486_0701410 [Trypanosoma vivax Y486]
MMITVVVVVTVVIVMKQQAWDGANCLQSALQLPNAAREIKSHESLAVVHSNHASRTCKHRATGTREVTRPKQLFRSARTMRGFADSPEGSSRQQHTNTRKKERKKKKTWKNIYFMCPCSCTTPFAAGAAEIKGMWGL